MSADGPHPADKGTEKQVTKLGDKLPASAAITSKDDNAIQQRAQVRDAIKSHRITTNPNNPLMIDMGESKYEQDGRPFSAAKAAEQAPRTSDTDYKPQKTGDHSYALGVNRQESPDTRTPAEKLQDFMLAATKRATDPEGWKAWAQSEINKFTGIGLGLNEAKDETKTAVAAGWKAMTDGTVIEFLSQPNAINAPVFKTVQNAFEAMSKDPEAVNKALEALGKVVMTASEGYDSLLDAEKGKVIGKVMFGMINPEGDLKDAEAALKIGDTIATHVDKVVIQTIDQALKAAEQAAKTSPELAQQTKQMLLDYLQKRGLTASELEETGQIPKGYFENLAGSGGGWDALNEQPSPDVVQQSNPLSCVSACGEMLTNGAIKQDVLIEQLRQYWPESLRQEHMTADLEWLAKELGPDWKGGYLKLADATPDKKLGWLLNRQEPFCAELYEGGPMGHVVIVDGVDNNGNLRIRDPFHATQYEMTRDEFFKYWTERAVFRSEAK
jgi:hypothetical protein